MIIKTFVELIKERPAIWMTNHAQYKHKIVVKKLWAEIKKNYPDSTVDDLKKRWKNLKDNYRKEYKKSLLDPVNFQSQWKYYDLMDFLRHGGIKKTAEESDNDPLNSHDNDTAMNSDTLDASSLYDSDKLQAEYLKLEKRKLNILESEIMKKNNTEHKSEDYYYLMSILPEMEKLAPIQKMRLRNKINQALMDEMNISMYGEVENKVFVHAECAPSSFDS